MIRFFLLCAIALGIVWFGTSVKMGRRTLWGHVKAVWSTDEAQEMKRGVEAGYREATRDAAPEPAKP